MTPKNREARAVIHSGDGAPGLESARRNRSHWEALLRAFVVGIASSVVIACVGASGCTQGVTDETSSRNEQAYSAPPRPIDLTVDCTGWSVTHEAGVLVELPPRPPRTLWSCPAVYVGRMAIEPVFSADYIAWRLQSISQCSCSTTEQRLELMYGRSWPAVTDPHRPFCQWFLPDNVTQAELLQAVRSQVSPAAGPLEQGASIGWCSEPGSGGCPSCDKAKMP
jgi:hypothetical protein